MFPRNSPDFMTGHKGHRPRHRHSLPPRTLHSTFEGVRGTVRDRMAKCKVGRPLPRSTPPPIDRPLSSPPLGSQIRYLSSPAPSPIPAAISIPISNCRRREQSGLACRCVRTTKGAGGTATPEPPFDSLASCNACFASASVFTLNLQPYVRGLVSPATFGGPMKAANPTGEGVRR